MRETCDLWTDPAAVLADRLERLELVTTFTSRTHLERDLLRCTCCGRLYFHEYHDDIDWERGNDPSWETFVPVRDEAEARVVLEEPVGFIGLEPRLHHDRDSDGRVRIGWLGRPGDPPCGEGPS